MTILDTDILSLLFADHPRVAERFDREGDEIVSTIVSRIEILEGRFASLMKAEDGTRLFELRSRDNPLSRACDPLLDSPALGNHGDACRAGDDNWN